MIPQRIEPVFTERYGSGESILSAQVNSVKGVYYRMLKKVIARRGSHPLRLCLPSPPTARLETGENESFLKSNAMLHPAFALFESNIENQSLSLNSCFIDTT